MDGLRNQFESLRRAYDRLNEGYKRKVQPTRKEWLVNRLEEASVTAMELAAVVRSLSSLLERKSSEVDSRPPRLVGDEEGDSSK